MAEPAGTSLLVVERILRDKEGVWRQISAERDLATLMRQMLVSSVLSLAAYGAVLGSSNGFRQALSSTVKLPVLFLATLAICLPTLYLFNLVFGARLRMSQAVALIMVCITVIAVLTLAFAPISLFFRITAQSYSFFKLLNIAILVLTAVVGLRFLTAGMRALNDHMQAVADAASAELPQAQQVTDGHGTAAGNGAAGNGAVGNGAVGNGAVGNGAGGIGVEGSGSVGGGKAAAAAAPVAVVTAPAPGGQRVAVRRGPGAVQQALPAASPLPVRAGAELPAERPASMTLLYIWIMLFGFVGTQLAWTLRPFFGSPDEPFQIFRSIHGTFYADVLYTIGHLLGG